MLPAVHSSDMLNLQFSDLHAPTPPITAGSPAFLSFCVNVSHMAQWALPTVIANVWHFLSLLYAQFVTAQSEIFDIDIAIKYTSPCA